MLQDMCFKLELIKLIPKNLNLTFFTPSLPMAIELLNNTSEYEEVIFIGGKLSRSSQLSTGGSSINILSEIKADICFLGTSYLDLNEGITCSDWEITQMKKAMIKALDNFAFKSCALTDEKSVKLFEHLNDGKIPAPKKPKKKVESESIINQRKFMESAFS